MRPTAAAAEGGREGCRQPAGDAAASAVRLILPSLRMPKSTLRRGNDSHPLSLSLRAPCFRPPPGRARALPTSVRDRRSQGGVRCEKRRVRSPVSCGASSDWLKTLYCVFSACDCARTRNLARKVCAPVPVISEPFYAEYVDGRNFGCALWICIHLLNGEFLKKNLFLSYVIYYRSFVIGGSEWSKKLG